MHPQAASTQRGPTAKARSNGFTLPEVLVTLVIVGLLSSIAIPLTITQRARAAETAVRADLTTAASAIEAALLEWRGQPIEGALFICHRDSAFPTEGDFPVTQVNDQCADGEWTARVQGTWADPTPALGGTLSEGVRLMGRISQTGDYCIMATSTRLGTDTLHIDSANDQIQPGTCFDAGWVDPFASGPSGPSAPAGLPEAPSGLDVSVVANVATVSWTTLENTTYAVSITGQPVKYFPATDAGTGTCIFPAVTCAGPAGTALPVGNYTATVRAQGPTGWGVGASLDFSVATSSNLPTAPRSPTAAPGNAQAQVSWLAPQSNLEGQPLAGYYVFQATTANGPWVQIATVAAEELTHTATGLQNGTDYWFRIVAFNVSGSGAPAITPEPVTPAPGEGSATPPGVPAGLVVTESANRQLVLAWDAPTSNGGANITGYKVEYKPTGEGSWTTATTTATSPYALTFTGNTVAPSPLPADWVGRKYDVRVSAINSAGTGDPVTATNKQPIPAIGDNVYAGYYAGTIDTRASGGMRYLLIASPKNLESELNAENRRWKNENSAGPAATQTRWNGLAATEAMVNAGSAYEAANWAWDKGDPDGSGGGSNWYLPAKDELELLYRNLKPTTQSNRLLDQISEPNGVNPSSIPIGVGYTTSSPSQTSAALFQSGGAQALGFGCPTELTASPPCFYWSSTERASTSAWVMWFRGLTYPGGEGASGYQAISNKSGTTARVRPVRSVEF